MIQKMCNICGLLNKVEVSYCTHCGHKIDHPSEYTLLKQCPVCKKYIRKEAQFCPKCGHNFTNESKSASTIASTTKICPVCKSTQKITAAFCTRCGTKLKDTKSEPNILICSNCGTVNPPNARFCKYCGTKFDIQKRDSNIERVHKVEELKQKDKPAFKIINCSNCGSSNHPDSRYCNQCGVQIRKKTVLCSICGQKVINKDSCPSCGRKLIQFENLENDLLRFLPIEKAQFLTNLALVISSSNYFFDINLIKKEILAYLNYYPTVLFIFSPKSSIDYLNSFKIGLNPKDTPKEKLRKIISDFEIFLNMLEERIDLFAISTFAYFQTLDKEYKFDLQTNEGLNFLLEKSLIAIEQDLSDLSLNEKELIALQTNKLIIMLFKLLVAREEEKSEIEKSIRGLLVALSMNIKDMNKTSSPKLSDLSEKFYAYSIFFSEEAIKSKIEGKYSFEEIVVLLQNLKSELIFNKKSNELLSISSGTLSSNFLSAVSSTLSNKKGFISSSLQNLTIESIQTCFDLKTENKNHSLLKKTFEGIICKNIFQFEKNKDLSTVLKNMFYLYNDETTIYSIIVDTYNRLSGNKTLQKKFVIEILRSLSSISIQNDLPWLVNLYERVKEEMKIKVVEELEQPKKKKSENRASVKIKREETSDEKEAKKEEESSKFSSVQKLVETSTNHNVLNEELKSAKKSINEKEKIEEKSLLIRKDKSQEEKKDEKINKASVNTKKTKQKPKPKKELVLG